MLLIRIISVLLILLVGIDVDVKGCGGLIIRLLWYRVMFSVLWLMWMLLYLVILLVR